MPFTQLVTIPFIKPVSPWAKSEDRRMAKWAAKGKSASWIAARLGRSPGATRQRALLINVRFCSLGKTHSRKQRARYKKKAV